MGPLPGVLAARPPVAPPSRSSGPLVASRGNAVDPGRPIAATSTGAILRDIADDRAEFWVRQIVGQFGYGETTVSLGLIGLWYLLVAALVGPALWFGTARLRIGIVAVGVGLRGPAGRPRALLRAEGRPLRRTAAMSCRSVSAWCSSRG